MMDYSMGDASYFCPARFTVLFCSVVPMPSTAPGLGVDQVESD